MSTPPKRDARAVLFTGGLLLVPIAALWLLLNPTHGPGHGGGSAPRPGDARTGGANGPDGVDGPADGDAPADPGTPFPPARSAWPPPRVAAGASTQADWTLLAVTLAPRSGFQTPPAPLTPPVGGRSPDAATRNPFLQVSAGAVGLWIGVRGGVGIRTLTIPQDGRRHAYPFGGFSLVSLPPPTGGVPFRGGPRSGPAFGGPPFGGPPLGVTTVGGGPSRSGGPVWNTLEWQKTGAASPPGRGGPVPGLVSYGQAAFGLPPYRMSASMNLLAPPGRPATETVTLTPSPFSAGFRVTALPLSADGRPTGKAVALLCQPVTANALFAQIPAGYDASTRQFRVTVARAGGGPKGGPPKGGEGSWLVAGLPPAAEDRAEAGPGGASPGASARFGPFLLRAVAAEAEDTAGRADVANPPPPWDGGPSPENLDGHERTGLPTLRFLLFARAAAPPPPGQAWLFQLDRAAPQWGTPSPPPGPRLAGIAGIAGAGGSGGGAPGSRTTRPPASGSVAAGAGAVVGPLGVFPLSFTSFRPGAPEWLLRDGTVGAAWPGQQHWMTLAGTAIRSATRTETVTFHDAALVHDAGFGGDRIVWHHPETVTTPSGIVVSVLNGTPGRRETTGPQGYNGGFGQGWWYDRGNAELLLAWRLPPGFQSGPRAPQSAPRVAFPADGAVPQWGGPADGAGAGRPPTGALTVSWDDTRPDPYAGAVAPPGARDARALAQAGYTFLRLSVWAAQTPRRTLTPFLPSPPALPPYSWREGPFVATAMPLPRRLAAITFRITVREEQERRPVVLRVPVSRALPPGADPRPAPPGALAAPAPLPPPPRLVPAAPRRRDTSGRVGGTSRAL